MLLFVVPSPLLVLLVDAGETGPAEAVGTTCVLPKELLGPREVPTTAWASAGRDLNLHRIHCTDLSGALQCSSEQCARRTLKFQLPVVIPALAREKGNARRTPVRVGLGLVVWGEGDRWQVDDAHAG